MTRIRDPYTWFSPWVDSVTLNFDTLGYQKVDLGAMFGRPNEGWCEFTVVAADSPGCKVERATYKAARAGYSVLRRRVKALRRSYNEAKTAFRENKTTGNRQALDAAAAALVDPVTEAHAAQSLVEEKRAAYIGCRGRLPSNE